MALGPIYPTESKKDVGFGPQGREAVERWSELLATDGKGNIGGIPLVVIGGINSDAQVGRGDPYVALQIPSDARTLSAIPPTTRHSTLGIQRPTQHPTSNPQPPQARDLCAGGADSVAVIGAVSEKAPEVAAEGLGGVVERWNYAISGAKRARALNSGFLGITLGGAEEA